VRDHREQLYSISCAGMFVFGVVLALPGTVLGLPDVVARFDLTLADRGALIAALFLGMLSGSFVSGPLVDMAGHRRSLAVSAGLIALCLPLFAVAPNYPMALVALAAIGLASAGVNTASNALSSDLFPHQRGRRMNGIAVAVGAGGLSLPTVTALTAGLISWPAIIGGAAVLALAVGIAAWRSTPIGETSTPPAAGRMTAVLKQPGLIWFAILVTLAAGTDYRLDAGGELRRLCDSIPVAWDPCYTVVVAFTAGWSLPTGVPAALEARVIDQVKLSYASRKREPGLRAMAIEGIGSETYSVAGGSSIGESGLLVSLESALGPYRHQAV